MAFLAPDKVITTNGVTVKVFDLTVHNPNIISMPSKRIGNCEGVTIHNTGTINAAAGTTMAEQYTRATYNGNMNTVRVHYYVDSAEAWQNLPLTQQSWHAGQSGKNDAHGSEVGNAKTISIECIMGGVNGYEKAEDNAARLAAKCLYDNRLTIDRLYTHNYWCNVRQGKTGSVDYLNTTPDHYKGCPVYIIPHWAEFKARVQKYLEALAGNIVGEIYCVQVGAFSSKTNAMNFLENVKKTYPAAFVKENGLYYVQVGAFKDRTNAENYLKTVKKDYPGAFIKVMQ